MENYGDLMSIPPMYRDIGSTFLAHQMPIPMGGPYAGSYGIAPMKAGLTQDKFEFVQKNKEKQKAQVKKVFGVLGGIAAAALALVVLKKKVPAVGEFLTKAFDGCKGFFKNLFSKKAAQNVAAQALPAPKVLKALPPHIG